MLLRRSAKTPSHVTLKMKSDGSNKSERIPHHDSVEKVEESSDDEALTAHHTLSWAFSLKLPAISTVKC